MSAEARFTSIRLVAVVAAVTCAIALGAGMVAIPIALVATGDPLDTPAAVALAVASVSGFVLVTAALCRVARRLAPFDREDHGDDGGGAGGGPGRDPVAPIPPSDEPDWWPQFERDLRAYLEARDRAPVAA